jgi:hypothetical protein
MLARRHKTIFRWRIHTEADDEDIATNDTSTPTPVSTLKTHLGPITHTRARRLTHQVSINFDNTSW